MVEVAEVISQDAPHNPAPEVKKVEVPETELNDLRHRADVSSQNFERAKKAEEKVDELTSEITRLQEQVPSEFRDERVGALQSQLAEIQQERSVAKVQEKYPQLKEVWSDFETFRADEENKGMNLVTAAKAFLAEKGLMDSSKRPGLERPTGGDRTPIASGMTPEQVKSLRETDYRKYSEMVRKGQIKLS